MVRVVGLDPGTVTLDACMLEDGRPVAGWSWPTAEAVAAPDAVAAALRSVGEPVLVAGPSGYGLPLRPASEVDDRELRLAFLAPPGESGGIGGLRRLTRRLAELGLPVVYTPGVIHLPTVPAHRKVNRVDLGTADKLCAAVLGVAMESARLGMPPGAVSFILVELGGAFSAAVAVERGVVVDGLGGTSGPIGWRAPGALDGEVAYLAGTVPKDLLFRGGAAMVAADSPGRTVAIAALAEGAARAVRQLQGSAPSARTILLSGRTARDHEIGGAVRTALAPLGEVRSLEGFGDGTKQGAQGAAVLADGLAGGTWRELVETMRIREAEGTVLDHLYVISPAAARRRLGLDDV